MSLNTKCTQEPIQPAAHRLYINRIPKGLQKKIFTKDFEAVILFALTYLSLPWTKDTQSQIAAFVSTSTLLMLFQSLLVPGRDIAVLTKSSISFTSKKVVVLQPGRRLTPFSYMTRASYLHIYNLT